VVDLSILLNKSAPLLPFHYTNFIATTGRSVPVHSFGTLFLETRLSLEFSLNMNMTGSRSSMKEPKLKSRRLNAGYRLLSKQVSRKLVPERFKILVLISSKFFSTRRQRFTCVRLFNSHLILINVSIFSSTLTTMTLNHSRLR
jgi:hypothetical protein